MLPADTGTDGHPDRPAVQEAVAVPEDRGAALEGPAGLAVPEVPVVPVVRVQAAAEAVPDTEEEGDRISLKDRDICKENGVTNAITLFSFLILACILMIQSGYSRFSRVILEKIPQHGIPGMVNHVFQGVADHRKALRIFASA